MTHECVLNSFFFIGIIADLALSLCGSNCSLCVCGYDKLYLFVVKICRMFFNYLLLCGFWAFMDLGYGFSLFPLG
jgi:hypothetical protein